MKVCEVIKLIEKDGWNLVATRGSHRPGHDLAPGMLNSIFKQA